MVMDDHRPLASSNGSASSFPTDDALLEAARLDRAAFAAVFDRHAVGIFRFAAHRLDRALAEDILAETFARAFARWQLAYTTEGSLRAWLHTIARNLIADELRRQTRSARAQARLRGFATAEAAEVGIAADPVLLSAVESLREEERETLLLLAWGELSYAEIAVVTGVAIGTVRSRLNRADGGRLRRRRTSTYVPARDIMDVIVDDIAQEGERRAPSSAANAATLQLMSSVRRKPGRDGEPFVDACAPDPVADVENLLAEGELRDEGERVRNGRRVRVLTGGSTRGDGRQIFQRTTIEYLVDAESFAPIAVTSTTRMEPSGESATVRAAFADYERIPLTSESARLLEIQPERPPKVTEVTIEEIKRPPRGRVK
jgi:RNA polymerase sigma factor (sigma-70 family)